MNFNTPPKNPVESAKRWFEHAVEGATSPTPLAMTLSTVNEAGNPSSRVVLQKGFDDSGSVFFTNYQSDKANDIVTTESVSLLFYWHDSQRQISIQGKATKLTSEESDEYFSTRPRESQIGAWASEQSAPLTDRSELIARVESLSEKWAECEVPRPEHWGGYRVSLNMIEFWEGQEGRLHDRIRYTDNGGWSWEYLQP